MGKTISEWMSSGGYLPQFLRDFHAQKSIFKWMQSTIAADNYQLASINWIAAHCYVIDVFLWHMAKHGYTLQPSRFKAEFYNLDKTVGAYEAEKTEAFRKMMSDRAVTK